MLIYKDETIELRLQKGDGDEWQVRWYTWERNVRHWDKEKSYYTNHRKDAVDTGIDMAVRHMREKCK